MIKKKSLYKEERNSVFAGAWWLFFFFAGLISQLYFYMSIEGSNKFSGVAESIGNSLSMFAFNFKYSELLAKEWSENVVDKIYCAGVFFTFIGAGLWTYAIVITGFFSGLLNNVFIYFRNLFVGKKGVDYVIIGVSDEAEVFFENLKKDIKSKAKAGEKHRIVFITGGTNPTIENGFYEKIIKRGVPVIKGAANESNLKRAGVGTFKRKTIVVALTNSDEINLSVAKLLSEMIYTRLEKVVGFSMEKFDKYIKELLEKAWGEDSKNATAELEKYRGLIESVNLEGRIAYQYLERSEHFTFAEKAFGKINFFNKYDLCAKRFFLEHPITNDIAKYIDVEKARLKGEYSGGKIYKNKDKEEYIFKNVFVGFGKRNYQMLKTSIMCDQVVGADYRAVVYDKGISYKNSTLSDNEIISLLHEKRIFNKNVTMSENLAVDSFKHQAPGLFGDIETQKDKFYLESPKENYDIVFKGVNVLTEDFYADLAKEIAESDLTSIYVCLGDDKINVETALEIRRYLAARIEDISKIRLYVKTKKRSTLSDNELLNSSNGLPLKIECFGFTDEVFCVEEIVSLNIDVIANGLFNQWHGKNWCFLSESEKDSNRSKLCAFRSILGFLGFDLEIKKGNDEKDEEKVWKAYEDRYGLSSAEASKLNRLLDFPKLENGVVTDTARNNLARLEHLRWNSCSLSDGWTKKPLDRIGCLRSSGDDASFTFDKNAPKTKLGRKNELLKQHACITTYEGLLELRKRQAYLSLGESLAFEEAYPDGAKNVFLQNEELFDTIIHDYKFLDELKSNMSKIEIYNLGIRLKQIL